MKNENNNHTWLTVKEASSHYRIKRSTLYLWVGQCIIPHYKVGRLVRFKPEEVGKWLEEHKHNPRSGAKEPKLSIKPPSSALVEPCDIARNAIYEVLGSGYNHPQRETRPSNPERRVVDGTLS